MAQQSAEPACLFLLALLFIGFHPFVLQTLEAVVRLLTGAKTPIVFVILFNRTLRIDFHAGMWTCIGGSCFSVGMDYQTKSAASAGFFGYLFGCRLLVFSYLFYRQQPYPQAKPRLGRRDVRSEHVIWFGERFIEKRAWPQFLSDKATSTCSNFVVFACVCVVHSFFLFRPSEEK